MILIAEYGWSMLFLAYLTGVPTVGWIGMGWMCWDERAGQDDWHMMIFALGFTWPLVVLTVLIHACFIWGKWTFCYTPKKVLGN